MIPDRFFTVSSKMIIIRTSGPSNVYGFVVVKWTERRRYRAAIKSVKWHGGGPSNTSEHRDRR